MVNKFAVFIHFYSFLRLFNSSYLKTWSNLNLPFNLFLLIEMPSLNRNDRVACLECGREYTRLHASRHCRFCGVLKCSNCNFYTYSKDELTNHFKKKHCQYNVKLCAQQSPNTLQEKVKFIILIKNRNYYEYLFLLNPKNLNNFDNFEHQLYMLE